MGVKSFLSKSELKFTMLLLDKKSTSIFRVLSYRTLMLEQGFLKNMVHNDVV